MQPLTHAGSRYPTATIADERLLHQIAQGDEAALQVLYERHRSHVYALAYRITQDRMTTEESTQDAFHDVWQSARTFDPAPTR